MGDGKGPYTKLSLVERSSCIRGMTSIEMFDADLANVPLLVGLRVERF